MIIELILQCNKLPFVTGLNQIETKMQITKKCFCITNACLNSSTLSFSSLDLFIGQASLTTCSGGRVLLQVERVGEKHGKTVSGRGD